MKDFLVLAELRPYAWRLLHTSALIAPSAIIEEAIAAIRRRELYRR